MNNQPHQQADEHPSEQAAKEQAEERALQRDLRRLRRRPKDGASERPRQRAEGRATEPAQAQPKPPKPSKQSQQAHPLRLQLTGLVAAAVLLGGGAVTWAVSAADTAAPVESLPGNKSEARPQARSAAKPSLTVMLAQPQRTDLAVVVPANGNITAWQEAIVGAESNGLRLAEVRVNVGDTVRKGQVLATFVSELAQADLAQGRAAVAEAEATLSDAAANAQRARELQTTGALSAQQINQFLTTERTAQARLDALRASAKVQQLRLTQTQVLAPDEGVISARNATVGAVVPAGLELFRLIRGGRLEWRAEVAASELAQIQPGMAATLTPAGGSPVVGKVRMVAPTVDAATRNGIVYVDLPRTALPSVPAVAGQPAAARTDVRAGMFARGEFNIARSEALTLPQSAVLLRDGFSYVFKVGRDNKVQQQQVSVGRRVGDRIELTKGLEATARVVASGAGFLSDGDTVRVVDAAPAAAPASAPGAGSIAAATVPAVPVK